MTTTEERERTTRASHLIGWTGEQNPRNAVYVEIELRDGHEPPRLLPRAFAEGFTPYDNPARATEAAFTFTTADACGAGVPEIIADLIAGVSEPDGGGQLATGWSVKRLEQLATVAETYHGGTHAGCAHQRAEGWTVGGDRYREARPTDHALGEACQECGYRFGHGWVFDAMPADVLAFVRGLVEEPGDEIVSPMLAFAREHGITAEAVEIDQGPQGQRIYSVTLRRPGGRSMKVEPYSMGAALEGPPTAELVLNSIAADIGFLESEPERVEPDTRAAIAREERAALVLLGAPLLLELRGLPQL